MIVKNGLECRNVETTRLPRKVTNIVMYKKVDV